jgi:probable phosphoglycerate mutase
LGFPEALVAGEAGQQDKMWHGRILRHRGRGRIAVRMRAGHAMVVAVQQMAPSQAHERRARGGEWVFNANVHTRPTTELILIRHGETAWNRELRFQGMPMCRSTTWATSRRAASACGWPAIRRSSMISSDLMRAQQTAAPAALQLSLPVVTSVGLREQHFGIVEGMRADEIQACIRVPGRSGWSFARGPRDARGRKSAREFHTRIVAALGSMATAHKGQRLIVVTHGGVLDMVWRTAQAAEPERAATERYSQCGLQPHPHCRPRNARCDRDRRLGRHAASGRPAAATNLRPARHLEKN